MKASHLQNRKSLLRNQLRRAVKKIGRSTRLRKSEKIVQRLMEMFFFKKAEHILIYVALEDEVKTQELILKSLAQKKIVYLPHINRRKKQIRIYRIQSWPRDVRQGSYGILEPRALKHRLGRVASLDLIVVPGMGFDSKGGRLGRGGGYFDRFLMKAKKIPKVGLAFREQKVRKIPMDKHDIRITRVITD